jgi:branched-chain amino acid transport system ATP-binding protein
LQWSVHYRADSTAPAGRTEQNATAALQIAHNTYVMENGEIVMQGSADALFRGDRMQQAYLGM